MTGRGAGFCAGYDAPRFRAWRRGGGRGRGRRHGFRATGLPRWAGPAPQISKEDETEALEEQAQWLGEQLAAIQERLAELKE
jgi:hypothetical protein